MPCHITIFFFFKCDSLILCAFDIGLKNLFFFYYLTYFLYYSWVPLYYFSYSLDLSTILLVKSFKFQLNKLLLNRHFITHMLFGIKIPNKLFRIWENTHTTMPKQPQLGWKSREKGWGTKGRDIHSTTISSF